MDSDECIICFEKIKKENGNVSLKCKHMYCIACFVKHMRIDNKCALCRIELENVDFPVKNETNNEPEVPDNNHFEGFATNFVSMIAESIPIPPVENEQGIDISSHMNYSTSSEVVLPNIFSNLPFFYNFSWVERTNDENTDDISSVD